MEPGQKGCFGLKKQAGSGRLWGAMGKYDKEYEAFEIFEQIQNEKSREESVPRPLPLSFEEAPYYEIAYDAEPVLDGVTASAPEAFSLSGDRAGGVVSAWDRPRLSGRARARARGRERKR